MTKPFSTAELLARLRVLRRHAQPEEADNAVFHSGPLEVDLAARRVAVRGQEVKLTATEYSFLRLLVRNSGKVVTHRQILKEVWGPAYVGQTHYLRVYVAHLREKIETDPARPELLLTEPGVGYRLEASDTTSFRRVQGSCPDFGGPLQGYRDCSAGHSGAGPGTPEPARFTSAVCPGVPVGAASAASTGWRNLRNAVLPRSICRAPPS